MESKKGIAKNFIALYNKLWGVGKYEQDRTGQDRTGQDRTGQDRTGQRTRLLNFVQVKFFLRLFFAMRKLTYAL